MTQGRRRAAPEPGCCQLAPTSRHPLPRAGGGEGGGRASPGTLLSPSPAVLFPKAWKHKGQDPSAPRLVYDFKEPPPTLRVRNWGLTQRAGLQKPRRRERAPLPPSPNFRVSRGGKWSPPVQAPQVGQSQVWPAQPPSPRQAPAPPFSPPVPRGSEKKCHFLSERLLASLSHVSL